MPYDFAIAKERVRRQACPCALLRRADPKLLNSRYLILSMLRTISVTICNRISSAAAVLLPNDQDLCAARPAGVPPRRQGALFDPRNQYHYGPCGIEGLVKVICTFPCRLSLDVPFTSLQRATVAGSKVRQCRRYLPSHHKEQNNHYGEFYNVRYIKGRYSHAIPFTRKRHFNIVETICLSKKRKHRNTSFRITAPRVGDERLSELLC